MGVQVQLAAAFDSTSGFTRNGKNSGHDVLETVLVTDQYLGQRAIPGGVSTGGHSN